MIKKSKATKINLCSHNSQKHKIEKAKTKKNKISQIRRKMDSAKKKQERRIVPTTEKG